VIRKLVNARSGGLVDDQSGVAFEGSTDGAFVDKKPRAGARGFSGPPPGVTSREELPPIPIARGSLIERASLIVRFAEPAGR
jgi:hypothetical protein